MIDVESGGLLAFVSMPAYDPNVFSDGISPSEWAMLSGNDHLPAGDELEDLTDEAWEARFAADPSGAAEMADGENDAAHRIAAES